MASPLRESSFSIDPSTAQTGLNLVVPSLGIDASDHHFRVAVVRKQDEKLKIDLATFTSEAAESALCYAKTNLSDDEGLSIFITGNNEKFESLISAHFPKASGGAQRRDKLDCHNFGAFFLLENGFPEEDLFHLSASKSADGETVDFSKFRMFMSPKMIESIDLLEQKIKSRDNATFPAVLSVLGANNLICQLNKDATYQVLDARSCSADAINKTWRVAKRADCKVEDYAELIELAEKGDRRKVDTLTNEFLEFVGFYSMMPRNFPIFNFGKMERLSRDQVAHEDLARAVVGNTMDMAFTKAKDLAVLQQAYPIYFSGSLVQHQFIREEIALRFTVWAIPGTAAPKFFKSDAIAALGACCNHSL